MSLTTILNKRVLFTDDDQDMRELVEVKSKVAPFEVALADSSRGCLAKYHAAKEQGKPFDLLVIDLAMPGEDGMTTIEKIRAVDKETCICVFTAFNEPIAHYFSAQLGITEIWDKEVILDIIERIAEVLSRDICNKK